MELLEYFYNRNNKIVNYHQRKFNIKDDDMILIYGSPASGKTSLVLDYLRNYETKKSLYIDFKDPKFYFKDIIEEDIEGFVERNNIEILVLDHYLHNYFEYIPKVKKIILISSIYYDYGDKFSYINLPLLDYEEFFSFQKRLTESQIFNLFIKRGTLPQLSLSKAPKEQIFLNFIESHFNESEQRLLNVLAHFNGAVVTTFQIYNYAKERYRISKDLIYREIKSFEEKNIISFIFDYKDKKKKKLLFFDFALAKYLTLTQTFPRQFETMIALSLHKHNIFFKTFDNRGYITENNHIIIPTPFETKEISLKKAVGKFSNYKKSDIQKVYIVTVTNSYEFKIENIEFEALPFYEWIIINDEY